MSVKLAGLAEVAEICGVTKRTAVSYVGREDFPKPLDRIAAGKVWSRRAVERWAAANLPLATGAAAHAARRKRRTRRTRPKPTRS